MRDRAAWHGPRSWRVLNAVLGLLALGLAAGCVVLAVGGAEALPGTTAAEKRAEDQATVTTAARKETLAFLEVDYRRMGPLTAAVLDGATGVFRTEYASARGNLIAIAKQSRARSTGTVRSIGIGDIGGGSATVFVAADSSVTNKDSQGRRKARYYRLRLTLVRTGDTWLTSNLRFVS